jgi:hypothetical protein
VLRRPSTSTGQEAQRESDGADREQDIVRMIGRSLPDLSGLLLNPFTLSLDEVGCAFYMIRCLSRKIRNSVCAPMELFIYNSRGFGGSLPK